MAKCDVLYFAYLFVFLGETPRMRIPIGAVALGGAVAVAMLAGCSGLGQSSAVPNSQSLGSIARQQSALTAIGNQHPTVSLAQRAAGRFFAPAALLLGGGLIEDAKSAKSLYVGLFYAQFGLSGSINDYAIPDPKNKPPTCEVSLTTSNVNGFGVNALHDVYVPELSPPTLSVFPPKCGTAISTVDTPGNVEPEDAAFNEKTKTAFIALGRPPGVAPIKYGAKKFGTVLTCSALFETFGDAVDSKGNVYATGSSTSDDAVIVEWPGAKAPCKTLAVTGLNFPIGIEFDSTDNLIIEDAGAGLIDIFTPPYSGAATRTITPKGEPVYGKLDSTGTNLYVSNSTAGSADVYTYKTGTYVYSITNGLSPNNYVEGIAVDPP
jgi:hypothetical protein